VKERKRRKKRFPCSGEITQKKRKKGKGKKANPSRTGFEHFQKRKKKSPKPRLESERKNLSNTLYSGVIQGGEKSDKMCGCEKGRKGRGGGNDPMRLAGMKEKREKEGRDDVKQVRRKKGRKGREGSGETGGGSFEKNET